MARRKRHPLQLALEALGRTSGEVEHCICEGDKVEIFFFCTPPAVPTPAVAPPGASPFARPTVIPPEYLGATDINDLSTGADAPIEASELLRRRPS